MQTRVKIAIAGVVALVLAGLLALAAPVILPFLPERVQAAVGGTIETVPGTVEELFAATGLGEHEARGRVVSHAEVDDEYVIAAKIWPWELPEGWGFPKNRGVQDAPGAHWNGMGVAGAFSKWARASLGAVKDGRLAPDAANRLLDEVEDATLTLLDAGVLSDRRFVSQSVTPLRP